jgi:peptide/nickel transport system substrate-binding protein
MEKKTKTETQILQFSLATPDAPELVQTAKMVQAMWKEIGADVEVKIFETGELNQNVIRPRRYDALLFGEIIGRDLDVYAFWHSSQRIDPGLNITGYVNLKVDKILETARTLPNLDDQIAQYQKFETEVKADIPAIFLYSPQFMYVLPNKIQGLQLGSVTVSAERFANIYEWYIETDSVWKIFAPKKQ